MKGDLKKSVLECLKTSGWSFETPNDSVPLKDQGIDSLVMALWVVEIERKFGIRMPPEKLRSLETLEDVLSVVESQKGKK